MKRGLILLLTAATLQLMAQDVYRLKKEKPTERFDNIHVRKISDSEEQSTFIIWVQKKVRLHKHAHHTENIYVISGKGEMILGDEKFVIKKGDFFTIPKGTPHGLNVLSSKPVKVLSIQSPKFTGKDRIFINKG